MSAAKSERLMNLLIMLLVQQRFVSKDRIRAALYFDTSDEAFEKMFERDKEELRSLGVPIEVGSDDPFFNDEPGYRVQAKELQLPAVTFDADEAAVVSLAARAWDHAGMAQAADEAERKLATAGASAPAVASAFSDVLVPRLSAQEPSYEAFVEAAWTRTPVAFGYGRPGQVAAQRKLEPWGVVRSFGRWYAVGRDIDRGEERIFRLSRVTDQPKPIGEAGSFERPAGVDAAAVVRRLAPAVAHMRAELLVRSGAGHGLRRGALVAEGVPGPTDERWDRVVIEHAGHDLVSDVLAHGADVVVLAPADLRAEVITRLQAMSSREENR